MTLAQQQPPGVISHLSPIKSESGVTGRAGLLMVCASDFLQEQTQ